MKIRGGACLGFVALCILAVACGSGFGSNEGGGDTDAGPDAATDALPGDPTTLTISAEATKTVVQGKTAALTVTILHHGATPVDFEVAGLPPGVTVAPASAASSAGSIDLAIVASVDAQQGTAKGIKITGSSAGVTAEATFDLVVNGASGALDTTYGTKGSSDIEPAIVNKSSQLRAIATGPTDVSYTVFQTLTADVPPHSVVTIVARDANGNPATSWNATGMLQFNDPAAIHTYPYGIFMQSANRILVYGNAQIGPSYQGVIFALDATGKLDTTWGTSGFIHFNFDPATEVWALAPTPDGTMLLVSGRAGNDGWIARLTSGGMVDTGFSGGNATRLLHGTNETVRVHSLIPQADGGSVIAAHVKVGSNPQLWYESAYYVKADGTFDTAKVPPNGGAVLPVGAAAPGDPNDFRGSIVAAPSGKFLSLRCDGPAIPSRILAQRVDAKLTADSTFTNGLPPAPKTCIYGNAVSTKDSLYVAWAGVEDIAGAVARLKPDGTVDTTFAESGVLRSGFGIVGTTMSEARMALQSDGKILVVAQGDGTDSDTKRAVQRYWP